MPPAPNNSIQPPVHANAADPAGDLPLAARDQRRPARRQFLFLGSLLWLVTLLAIGAELLTTSKAQAIIITLIGSAIATAALLVWVTRRRLAYAQLERDARTLLAIHDQPGSQQLPPPRPISSTRHELRPLTHTLNQLGLRIDSHLKDLAKKSSNLQALLDTLDEPVLATDSHQRILFCNRAAEHIADPAPPHKDAPARSFITKPVKAVFTQQIILDMHDAARAGEMRRQRVELTTPLGTRTFLISAAPLPVAWGQGVFGSVIVLRDITELAQAVQVKTDFVANASHELRTPVAAISGAAETLLDDALTDPHMGPKLAGMILQHAQRLQQMLSDLLDLSRLETPDVPLNPEPIDPVQTIDDMRSMFADVCAEKDLNIKFINDDQINVLHTDRRLFMLILRNLVENATKFARQHTPVTITLSILEEEVPAQPDTSNAHEPAQGTIRLEVTDQGIGIPLAHQDRVFERYFQIDSARTGSSIKRGTGLGLSIVKHAARALHGSVGLHSEYTKGTTVWAELPAAFTTTDSSNT